MATTQEGRLISIETPLGKDALLLQGFTGREGISRLFSFHLDLLSEKESIDFKKIVGQNVTIQIALAAGATRYINGFVSRFAQSGSAQDATHYQMEVVPWLWFLTRIADCRIFQDKTIPQIVEAVFQSRGFSDYKLSLTGTYDQREYCVQYRETDFNFVSRLMEQYGIFYYFEHNNGKHTMMLGDSPSVNQPCPNQATAHYIAGGAAKEVEDVITAWQMEQELRTGKYTHTDYNFETPSTNLLSDAPTVSTCQVGPNTSFEIYDYPGEYLKQADGKSLAKLRMEEEEAGHLVASGSSDCRAFTSGYKFKLEDYYRDDMNQNYVLTEIQHNASAAGSYSQGSGESVHYSNHFTCIPDSVPFRPPRITPKPFVQGPQTAMVVGKQGEEIWVDNYGRVRLHFYWDRLGKKDDTDACWIRVSQPWAGAGWGAIWIPRIGQEVIVSFLEGDPDRPLVTGRVYNAEQVVPYTLPDNQTRSTFLSRSSKNGDKTNFNEIRFEDKKGDEQVFINAEHDMDLRVENDSREYVGNNRHLIVHKEQHELVEADKHGHVKGAKKEAIDGDSSLTVSGDVKQKMGKSVSLTVGQSVDEKIGTDWVREVVQDIHIKAGMTLILEAGMQLSLKGPGGFVDIGPTGVTIQGSMVLINSGGSAGSGRSANPQTPDAPTDPDTADDGSKGTKLK
ncbi:MAG: type VI secretion system tip protein TssI/VgrG [Candidatus Korobacteraceae bacterium]